MKYPVNIANHALKLIDVDNNLSSLGLNTDIFDSLLKNESGFLNCRQILPLVQKFQKHYPTGCAGLHFGQSQTFGTWGRLGYTIMTSKTIYRATYIALKYQKIMGHFVNVDLKKINNKQTEMTFTPLIMNKDIWPFCIESTIASMLSIYSQLTKDKLHLLKIEFSYKITKSTLNEYQKYFNCEMRFNCDTTKIIFLTPKNKKLEMHDIANYNMFLEKLIERHKELNSDNLVLSIKNKINIGVGQFASQAQIAGALNISTSLLSKRLSKIGMNYREILESVKQDIAVKHLKNPKPIKMYEIALLTGYTDISNFRKAFLRWEGVTPSEFKRLNGA